MDSNKTAISRIKRAIKSGKHEARTYFNGKKGELFTDFKKTKCEQSGVYKFKHHIEERPFSFRMDVLGRIYVKFAS